MRTPSRSRRRTAPVDDPDFILYVDQAPGITSANTATFTYNESASFDVTTTGYPNVSCSETGLLPAGVTFAPSGALAGTPTQFGTYLIQHRLHERLRH